MNIDYQYLRPQKAAWLRAMYADPFDMEKPLSVWRGRNATILPLRKENRGSYRFGIGGVVDEDGQAVALSAIEARMGAGYPFENPEYRDEKVVYCGYMINHWGHFLVEAVNRLWFALESDEPVDKYVFYLKDNEQREIKGNYREFLELIGVWDKCEFISHPTTYREVIVPESAFVFLRYSSPQYRRIFDTVAQRIRIDPQWKTYDKLFFTRSAFAKGNHSDFGVEMLDSFFRNNGYEVVAPEKLSLSQLIYMIRSAKEIATISGTVHHNILFGNQGQKITIMERLIVNIDYQVSVNQVRDLDVTYVDANFNLTAVSMAGPFCVGYNHILQRFQEDKKMNPPDPEFTTRQYRDACFKGYMRSYQDNYRYRWHMDSSGPELHLALYEAYQDNYQYFEEYLNGSRPFLPEHYFQIHYLKQWIKRLLGRG